MIDVEKLNKYFRGDSSQKEKEEVQLWLEKNKSEFMSLRSLYDITLAVMPETEIDQRHLMKKKHRNIVFELVKIAAVALLTFAISYYYMDDMKLGGEIEMQTLHVPAGQRAELTLADGTKVWLNGLTTLTFPRLFTESSRKVYLDGEAYFDVKHDDEKKFTVITGQYNINVLGTEFNVTAYSRERLFETSLIRGFVEVESANGMQKLLLTPGNKACLKDDELMISPILNYDSFLWRDGIISFKNERIEDSSCL